MNNEIVVYYEGNLSTKCLKIDSGAEVFTDAPVP